MTNENDQIISEGKSNSLCMYGLWKTYYPNGIIKVKGEYISLTKKTNSSSSCNEKNGDWYYYSENGELIRKELFSLGKLIEN